ncbi:MAG: Spy/CpxP family protein refolding chaperone [Syntrophobacteraceae bacterium]
MRRLLTGLTITLVAAAWMFGSSILFGSVAFGAEGFCGHHHCDHWRHHHGFGKMLHLTDNQKKEMFSIRLDERAKMKPLFQSLKAGREQLGGLARSAEFDESKVSAIAKSQAAVLAKIIVEKTRMRSRMYAVLTPEQRTKLEKAREEWKAHHEKNCH